HAPRAEQVLVRLLVVRELLRVAEKDDVTGTRGANVRPAQRLAVERMGDVGGDETQRAGTRETQRPRGAVRRVVERLRSAQDPLPGVGPDAQRLVVVDHT